MALDIEYTKALRSPADRRRLIEAIRNAPGHEPELDSVEWKSSVDLGEKRWKFEIARQVLGFGNRDPDTARHFDGCAYLVFGVEPGNLCGIQSIEASELEKSVEPYVGTAGPRWDFHYEEVDGITVLVVTIEPPAWGDPPFRLRKESGFTDDDGNTVTFRSGDTFVRKGARTEKANATDLDRLDERLLRGVKQSGLDIAVSWLSGVGSVKPVDMSAEARTAWLEAEGLELLSPLREFEQASEEKKVEFFTDLDTRSAATYEEEVKDYLEEAEKHLPLRLRFKTLSRGESAQVGLSLTLKNLTEDNFTEVRVELLFEQEGVVGAFDDLDLAVAGRYEDDFPKRPAIWGRQPSKPYSPFAGLGGLGMGLDVLPLSERAGSVENFPSSTRIMFAPVHLRPSYEVDLGPVHLIVDAVHAGKELPARWMATASNVSGRAEGTLTLTVETTSLSPADLMT